MGWGLNVSVILLPMPGIASGHGPLGRACWGMLVITHVYMCVCVCAVQPGLGGWWVVGNGAGLGWAHVLVHTARLLPSLTWFALPLPCLAFLPCLCSA